MSLLITCTGYMVLFSDAMCVFLKPEGALLDVSRCKDLSHVCFINIVNYNVHSVGVQWGRSQMP